MCMVVTAYDESSRHGIKTLRSASYFLFSSQHLQAIKPIRISTIFKQIIILHTRISTTNAIDENEKFSPEQPATISTNEPLRSYLIMSKTFTINAMVAPVYRPNHSRDHNRRVDVHKLPDMKKEHKKHIQLVFTESEIPDEARCPELKSGGSCDKEHYAFEVGKHLIPNGSVRYELTGSNLGDPFQNQEMKNNRYDEKVRCILQC
ncbi:hypothetical protein BDV95DRAFT_616562 [Massariosphaeria phaeospora]|uniref:Uncharacterized protein n=1 Tax=Massariosphaeria phaeospora TaxID=100035 RepID=A0A7C8MBW6_9PLEO|nr:hypothetical protein BDV95DRAFT_616562 [Massariosphaeria phaeospora]